MARLIRRTDWAATPLGPQEAWPQSLRTVVDLLLGSGFPMVALWGPELIQVYNDGYRRLMGRKHPEGLGQPTRACWPEVWPAAAPIFERVRKGETVTFADAPFPLDRHGDRQDAWFTLSCGPLRDEGGAVEGVLVTVVETTERVLAERRRDEVEAALRGGETRLAAIFANAAVGLSEIGLDGRLLRVNEELCRILGRVEADLLRRTVAELTHPDDLGQTQAAFQAVVGGRGRLALDKRYVRPDGTVVWANSRGTLLRHGGGQPDTMLVVTEDLTARRGAEAALRESEERFRQFGDASADVLWIRDAATLAFEYVSPAFEEIYGARRERITGSNHVRRWAEMIVPEDREKALSALRRVREGDHVLHAFRILRSDGAVRWLRSTDFPLLGDEGRVRRIAGIAHDATEEMELQERLGTMVAELQHRSRNLVGVVQGVAERTLATSDTLEGFRARLRGRLGALGRANALLSRPEEGDRITFDQLLETELQAQGVVGFDGKGEQVTLAGPRGVRLRSATVPTFALALHELASNALRHGALSRPEGRLEVAWGLVAGGKAGQRLRVDWRESGVAVKLPDGLPDEGGPAPRAQGYGRELIERALPYQLRASTSYEITPEGLRCTLLVPLSPPGEAGFPQQGRTEA